jgi:acyl-phosphate glycerol 3-phosphate acyltransferase
MELILYSRIIWIIIGYCFGLFQTAYIYGRMNNIDIRTQGSGNAGTTNALRVLGKKAGIIVFLGDLGKSVIAGLLAHLICRPLSSNFGIILALYAGLGVVLGHNYPFYLNFKGGKGIAVMAGILLVFDLRITAMCLVAFVLCVAVTRFVSLGSLVVVTIFFVVGGIFAHLGFYGLSDSSIYELNAVSAILVFIAFYKHKENIKRLIKGTENKIGQKK